MRDEESLCNLINTTLGDYLFVVVSNREPYIHPILALRSSVMYQPVG